MYQHIKQNSQQQSTIKRHDKLSVKIFVLWETLLQSLLKYQYFYLTVLYAEISSKISLTVIVAIILVEQI